MTNKFDKTEEELKAMSEEEFLAFLDEKANHLKQFTKPLSPYKSAKFATIGNAIENSDKGTEEANKNFPDVKKIRDRAYKEGLEFLIKQKDGKDK